MHSIRFRLIYFLGLFVFRKYFIKIINIVICTLFLLLIGRDGALPATVYDIIYMDPVIEKEENSSDETNSYQQNSFEGNENEADKNKKEQAEIRNETVKQETDDEEDYKNDDINSHGLENDVLQYLKTHFPIKGTHYEVSEGQKNESTGRKGYTVDIIPNDKDALKEIYKPLKGEKPYENERVEELFQVAENILFELPEVYDDIHVHSVYWKLKGEDGDPDFDDVMLIKN